jgi:chemotaxis signal transduction protein
VGRVGSIFVDLLLLKEPMHTTFLLIRSSSLLSALPLASVREVVPFLQLQSFAGLPPEVLGLCILRGVAVPVVDLGTLLSGKPTERCGRLIHLWTGCSSVLLAAEELMGIHSLESSERHALPAWLLNSARSAVESVGQFQPTLPAVQNPELLLFLKPEKLLPQEVRAAIERSAA